MQLFEFYPSWVKLYGESEAGSVIPIDNDLLDVIRCLLQQAKVRSSAAIQSYFPPLLLGLGVGARIPTAKCASNALAFGNAPQRVFIVPKARTPLVNNFGLDFCETEVARGVSVDLNGRPMGTDR